MSRKLLVIACAVLGAIALFAALVHTPPVRARALAFALERLRTDYGLEVRAERFDYNLLTFETRLRGVTIAAVEDRDEPFLRIDDIRVNLPWTILRRLELQSLEANGVRVRIVRTPDGTFNLPSGRGTREPELTRRVDIGRLVVRDLELWVHDGTNNLTVQADGMSMDLKPGLGPSIAGRLTTESGPRLQLGDRSITASRFSGKVAYDGVAFSFEGVDLASPEMQLVLTGVLKDLWTTERLEARYEGTLHLQQLAPWIPVQPSPVGTLKVSATLGGLLTDLSTTVNFSGDGVSWASLRSAALTGKTTVSVEGIAIESASLRSSYGSASGSGWVPFGEAGDANAQVKWQDFDAPTALQSVYPAARPRPAARITGNLEMAWPAGGGAIKFMRVENVARAISAGRGALSISGRLSLNAENDRWRARHDHQLASLLRVSGDLRGQLSREFMDSTVSGPATVTTSDLAAAVTRLAAAGLRVPLALQRARGALHADLQLAGTLRAPRVAALLEGTTVYIGPIGPAELESRAAFDRHRAQVDALEVRIGANVLRGAGTVNFDSGALAGDFDLSLEDLSQFGLKLPEAWRPAGTLIATGRIGGVIASPRVGGHISGDAIAIAGQQFERLDADLRFESDALILEQARAVQGVGRLAFTGRYEIGTGGYTLNATGRQLTVRPSNATASTDFAVSGLNLDFDGQGSLAQPGGRGRFNFARLTWGEHEIGGGDAGVALSPAGATVNAKLPDLRSTLMATIDLARPRRYTASIEALDASLARILPMLPALPERVPEITGTMSARATVTGTLQPSVLGSADLKIDRFGGRLGDVDVDLTQPAQLRYAEGELFADGLDVRVGARTRIAASGSMTRGNQVGELRAIVSGDLSDVAALARAFGASVALQARGSVEGSVLATGALDRPQIMGDLAVTDGQIEGIRPLPRLTLALGANYTNGVINVAHLNGSWNDAIFQATGALPARLLQRWLPRAYLDTLPETPGGASFRARVDAIAPGVFTPFVGPDALRQVEGSLSASLELETDTLAAEQLAGTVVLNRMDLAVAGQPLAQIVPTRISIGQGRVQIMDWIWGGPGSQFSVSGGAGIGANPQVALQVNGTADLRILGAFVSGSTAGRADLNVRVSGPASAPVLDGTVALREGEFRSADWGLVVSDLTGTVELTRDRLIARGVRADANGGTLVVDANVPYTGFTPTGGSIVVAARNVALNVPAGLQSEVDADLTLALQGGSRTLSGQAHVLRSAYREPLSLLMQVAALTRGPTVPAPGQQNSFARSTELDVSVATVEDLIVDNNYGRFNMSGDVRLAGTLDRPSLVGRATIQEGGEIFLGGRAYRVDRGNIDFSNPAAIEPDLDFSALTQIGGYDVTLVLRGPPDTVETELSSDPPLSQGDLVSLLVTGRTLDQGGTRIDATRDQMLNYLAGELLGFAGRAVGLDALRIEQGLPAEAFRNDIALVTETDPATRLTLSKYLRRDTEIVLSKNLRDVDALTWIISYRPRAIVELRGISRDNHDRAVEVGQDLSFGGSVRSSNEGAEAASSAGIRVSNVRITGDTGVDEAELLPRLKLLPGDRFNFFDWQEDRERLERFFHDTGFFEARISARRVEDDGLLRLVYDVARGSRTSLEIEGAGLPRGLVGDLEDLWTRAIFDRGLQEDVRWKVREHLAAQGYLQARVDVEFAEPAPAEKRLRVRIDPGSRTRAQQVIFEGNERVASDRLERLINDEDLEIAAWLDPARLSRPLTDFYATEGMFGASVEVGPPTFAGDVASLRVFIREGPQYRVSDVVVRGVSARPEQEVRAALGLQTGDVPTPAALAAAQQRVEADYRTRGFNAAGVTLEPVPNHNAGTVALTLNVNEGPQQVLADIAIAGVDRTRSSVIERAVTLELNEPVDSAKWNLVRRRLYDTGAFRYVDLNAEPLEPATPQVGVQPVRARVTVEEWAPWRLRYGFQVENERVPTSENREFGAGLVGDVQNRNLFGLAATGGIALRYERDRQLARAFYSTPTLLSLPVTSSLFLSQSREEQRPGSFLAFVTDRTAVTAEQRFGLFRPIEVSYSYRFERNHTFDPGADPDDPFALDLRVKVARLNGTAVLDTRDDPFDSRRGWFHSSNLEYATKSLGSDLRFAKYVLQQYYFHPVGERMVLGSAFRLGVGDGFGQELIPSERFLAGGGNSVRGYREDALGGVDALGAPRGGAGLLVLNQEARFSMYRWFRGVGFIDAGNVFDSPRDLSLSKLKVSFGFGLRVSTPFALLRADFGIPLSRPQGERRGRWFFSIGQLF